MGTEHERLKEILAEAAKRETVPERAEYVDAACGGNPELRAQVEILLQAHDQAGEFLEGTVVSSDETLPEEGPGTIVGRYKLLQEIGEGGFGRVFMAEQIEPLRRRVALRRSSRQPWTLGRSSPDSKRSAKPWL